ncbi:GtrA-like protein [Bremerella volcania]|uniref:GtrA-like protein n=1 Tax=Bremerella volcania TaxID=2527984 RepID=A0A518C399_9BACT|nr:GtrA family protein [Bremerella volcania]QDU73664.1 GtrA-like protein [Bremerella volcania]
MPNNSNENSPPKVSRQILRFLVIGGSSVAIDGICYALITTWSGISPDVAKGISYVCGMLFGFWGNKVWTFESTKRSVSEPIFYVLIYACTLGLNVGINRAVLLLAGDEFRLLGFFLATGTTTVANFVGMKFLAFREQLPADSTTSAPSSEPPEVAIPVSDRRAA